MSAGSRGRIALSALLTLAAGCIASNVVAVEDRAVADRSDDLVFTPANALVLDGLYESIDIRGDAAVSLRKIYYLFSPEGAYTAAALTEADGDPAFQTLNGTWVVSTEGLALDGREPVKCDVAPDHVRLTAPTGVVVLRRRDLR